MIHKILKDHETSRLGINHVFYNNCENSTTLVVVFAGAIEKLYVGATWFYNQQTVKGNFLFLRDHKDGNNQWTAYNDEKYFELVDYYLKKLNITDLITYGPSMGAIASILFGLKFKAVVIIAIDPMMTEGFDYDILADYISELKDDDFTYKQRLYLNYTFYEDGKIPTGTIKIINALMQKNILFTVQPFKQNVHLAFLPAKAYLFHIINTYINFQVSCYKTPTNSWF